MSKKINQEKRRYHGNNKKEANLSTSQNKNKIPHIRINKKWTPEEDLLLTNLIHMQKVRNWTEISKKMLGRTGLQCHIRWNKIKSGLKKGQWSIQEDKLLKEWIKKNGPKRWEQCGQFIRGRSGKQCREHWNNCLNPDLIKGEWTAEEDFLIMQFYEEYNGSWKKIIHLFNGRTENSIKNRFFSQLRKIATKSGNLFEKKCCAKIKLEELKKYISIALSEGKSRFLSKNKMTEEEFKNYLNEKNLLIKNKILEENENNENILTTNCGDLENSEKKENKVKSLFVKRNRSEDELTEDLSNIENEQNPNYFRIENDIEELNDKSINLDEKIENNDNIIKLFISTNDSINDNKEENISFNDIKSISNDNVNNEDDRSSFSFDSSTINNFNNFNNNFYENLDYKYKPSYEFLEKCGFCRADSMGTILIIDNNIINKATSINSYEEKKTNDNNDNEDKTIFEELNKIEFF